MHELDEAERRLLMAYRADQDPPASAYVRVLQRVEQRVAPEGTGVAPIPWGRSIALSVGIAAAILLLMRSVTVGFYAREQTSAATPAQAANASTAQAPPAAPVVRSPVPAPPPKKAPIDAAPVPEPPPPAAPTPAPKAAPKTTTSRAPVVAPPAVAKRNSEAMAAELAAFAAAKRARDASTRLTLLERLAREHPNGALAEERDVVIIETLCALGRTAAARDRARVFATRHPGSAFVDRLSRSCAPVEAAP